MMVVGISARCPLDAPYRAFVDQLAASVGSALTRVCGAGPEGTEIGAPPNVGRLAGGIAHDINNALSSVLSYAQLVLHELPPDAPMRDDLEEIRSAGGRAAALARQLLALSRQASEAEGRESPASDAASAPVKPGTPGSPAEF
jgi:signal transduction histidine kinase